LLCAPTGGILFDPLRAHKESSVLEGFFVVRPHRGDFIRPPPSSQKVLRFGGLFCCAPPQGGFYSTPSELTKSPPFWRAFLLCAPAGGILFDPLRAHKKSSVLEGFFVAAAFNYSQTGIVSGFKLAFNGKPK